MIPAAIIAIVCVNALVLFIIYTAVYDHAHAAGYHLRDDEWFDALIGDVVPPLEEAGIRWQLTAKGREILDHAAAEMDAFEKEIQETMDDFHRPNSQLPTPNSKNAS